MRRFAFLVLGLLLPALAFSQEMVKVNLIEQFDKVPAPPADAKIAYTRLVCTEKDGFESCDAEKFYQPTAEAIAALEQRLTALNAALAQPGVQAMQQIDPQEMQKKLEAMSPEQKIQFAMQMSQMALGMQSVQPESEEVQAAVAAFGEMSVAVNSEYTNPDATAKKKQQLDAERQRRQEEIKTWAEAEQKKIPQVPGGPGVGMIAEPKATHALHVATVEKQLAVDNEYLAALQKWWPEEIKKLQARFTPFQEKLAAVEYGEQANNTVHQQTLVQGQSMMLSAAATLIQISRAASESAGQLWQRKLKLEQEHTWR